MIKLCHRVVEVDESWREDLGDEVLEKVMGEKTAGEIQWAECSDWNKIKCRLINIVGEKVIMKDVDCFQTGPDHLWVPVETWEKELC